MLVTELLVLYLAEDRKFPGPFCVWDVSKRCSFWVSWNLVVKEVLGLGATGERFWFGNLVWPRRDCYSVIVR